MKKIISLLFFLMLTYLAISQSDTLVKWTFPNNPDDSLADGGLTINALSYIQCVGTSKQGFSNQGITTYSARTTGWNNGKDEKHWVVFLETTGYDNLKLSSIQRSSNTGPRDYKVQYRIGVSGSWIDVPDAIVTDTNDWKKGVLKDINLPAECNNRTLIYLRWLQTSNIAVNEADVLIDGASRIDDIIITGTQIGTGVSNISNPKNFIISPNPTNGDFVIKSVEQPKEIIIFDLLGNTVYKNSQPASQQKIYIDNLKYGFYIVKVIYLDNKIITKRLAVN